MITHQAGEFNTLVAIEQFATTQDSIGGTVGVWSAFANWWCRINPVSGNESIANQAVQAGADYKLDGPFIAGVTAKMRVNDHGVLYALKAPPLDWDNRHAYMTLLAKTGLSSG